ncbi:hypothetical protein [Streptomyces sp. NPDC057910]|uniref:hypothetical protein n=1 Tax=Streptomyces sp. NPDC057910 TaxID=3346278 RepID=UPI0036F094F5
MSRSITFRGGKRPAQPARPQLRLENYVTSTLADPPASVDWQAPIDPAGWPMYLNDQYGDCTVAEVGHHIELVTGNASGKTVKVSDADVLTGYEAVSGFVPGNESTDTGCYIADVMAYWMKTGIAGHKILAYASIHPSNTKLVQQAIALFGGVSVGMNVPQSAEDQFNAGKPWDYVKGSRDLGGHCVLMGAYGPAVWKVVTWGAEQAMTSSFYAHQVDEIWLPVTTDWFVNGKSPTGIDTYTLGQDYAAITGKLNPMPQPQPSPVPTPTPVPAGSDQTMAAAARTWLAAKGL